MKEFILQSKKKKKKHIKRGWSLISQEIRDQKKI